MHAHQNLCGPEAAQRKKLIASQAGHNSSVSSPMRPRCRWATPLGWQRCTCRSTVQPSATLSVAVKKGKLRLHAQGMRRSKHKAICYLPQHKSIRVQPALLSSDLAVILVCDKAWRCHCHRCNTSPHFRPSVVKSKPYFLPTQAVLSAARLRSPRLARAVDLVRLGTAQNSIPYTHD